MGQAFWLAWGSLGDSARIPSPGMDSEPDPSQMEALQTIVVQAELPPLPLSQDPLLGLHPCRYLQGTKPFEGSTSSNLPTNMGGRDYLPHFPVEDLESQGCNWKSWEQGTAGDCLAEVCRVTSPEGSRAFRRTLLPGDPSEGTLAITQANFFL